MIELSLHVKTSKEKFSLFFAVCESCTCFPLGYHFYDLQPPPPPTFATSPTPTHTLSLLLFLDLFCSWYFIRFVFSFFLNIISFFFYFGVCPLVYRSCIIPKPQNPFFFCTYNSFFLSFVFSSFFSSFFLFFLLAFFSIHLSHAFRFLGNRPRLDRFFPAAGAGACLFRQDTDWLVFGKRSSLQERNNN